MPFHLCKTKSKTKPFSVVLLSKNGEVISQHSLGSKEAAKKNISAQAKELNAVFLWQDDTLDKPKVYICYRGKMYDGLEGKTFPKYIPGINPKKKK